ncbi:non-ribosomal peptide synthetase [Dyella choica]|uniref:Amino acid adenylation domain-containing protein n=1 Tax=Dyella choica TaxID=1927959 RepID=A0A432M9Q1_9GAMM|nr:non-ribosomal peptide synthetase [Dyella choica]RUL78905.1 amino acid adenylation domain-containing protein [Dyella choica]
MSVQQLPGGEGLSRTNEAGDDSCLMAIVGMACRFPGAADYEQFWRNLRDGLSSIGEVPESRWDKEAFYSPDPQAKNKSISKWGGFVDAVEYFDADFFGVSAREAEVMDPQQRIMLEQAWACIEDAGYDPKGLSGTRTGVYIGVFNFDYEAHLSNALDAIEGHVSTGTHTALIPNRISHFLNLHGPSLPIDTACSSSLVALHEAAHAIRRGQCDQALVGGISVLCSPTHFISFSKTGMLSPDGSCKTFDERANGYVRGEGAAMLLIKPLANARRDNDRVVAVLRGSAINHGGRARTVTYPGSLAQSNVVAEALRDAAVPVDTVNYVEAHGTGTPKGDPIEVEGLKMAFSRVAAEQGVTLDEHSCGIGSVKTNVGHLESVAGLAGVIKTVLSMQHRSFPPLVHYQKLNPRISLADSPFFIVDQAQPWPARVDEAGAAIPRRAGISSFGFGGVNSHVIVEEYREPARVEIATEPALILLSAKTVAVLRQGARQLLNALASREERHYHLDELAYTLQVGRQAMAERLAFVADSLDAVRTQLAAWLEGDSTGAITGRVGAQTLTQLTEDSQSGDELALLLAERNLPELAKRWAAGHEIDWTRLYGASRPRRTALPTYPFAREKYWVEANGVKRDTPTLHPLVHQNTSHIAGLRFSSRFSGSEFFLADHVVKGARTLPGAAQLEMARGAVKLAMGWPDGSYRLRDVVWMRPVTKRADAVELDLALFPTPDGRIDFEIYSENDGGEPVVYTQGTVTKRVSEAVAPYQLEGFRSQCAHARLGADQIYAALNRVGLSYGPAHRALVELFVGEERALARIAMPYVLRMAEGGYVLHPSLLDAALQAAIGMREGDGSAGERSLVLPFALGELEVLAPCVPQMWAVIHRRATGAVQKFDLDLCDDQGVVCIRLKDFCVRAATLDDAGEPSRTALLHPHWREQPAAPVAAAPFARRVALFCGVDSTPMPGVECVDVDVEGDLARTYEDACCQLLEKLQELYRSKGRQLIQVVVPNEGEGMAWAGLGGMLRTAQRENPNLIGQLLAVGRHQDMAQALAENAGGDAAQVRYVDGRRMTMAWNELAPIADAPSPWKDHGVYLITGGAGGLGLIFAREIARQAKGATLILAARSPASEAVQADIRAIEQAGAFVRYRQVDVGDAAAVALLLRNIRDEFGGLNGIVHAAGVLRDGFIIKKTAQELREVLRAKVAGLVNLDLASREMALDSFICFASTSGALGNVGQADYAAANAFMDGYMQYRAEMVRQGLRVGRSLALDWPLWEAGGMQVDESTRQAMTRDTGLIPLRTQSSWAAYAQACASGMPQLLVAEGAIDRFKAHLAKGAPAVAPGATRSADPEGKTGDLQEKAVRYLVRQLAGTLKRPAHGIDAHAQMEAYGIDSILVMELTRALEEAFGTLSKTLLFEYQTIAALAGYFVQNHAGRLGELLGEAAPDASVATASETASAPPLVSPLKRRPRFGTQSPNFQSASVEASSAVASDHGAIAIIGLSGRYPQANDVESFWANLSGGKDSITEIPLERWDWRRYYDADRSKAGTTYSKWGGFLDEVDKFDPLFFNISPREAELMDPQERLFLECVHGALEDAGYTRESAATDGSVGVFVGVMYEEYQLYGAQAQARGQNVAVLNSAASVANRISYYCNFHGPSLALDTMCSSSLTAIHLACQSLRQGGCAVAVAGGVNVSIHPNKYLMLAQGKFISGKGRCESFGEGGEGYVPGEGVGAVLLKPLAQAVADGDHIYGVIRATAINHGGKTNGYTVPNPNAQAKVIEQALRDGGVDARAISYIEAHGTGTSLGDPIEIAGLSKAFGQWTQARQYCAIGSAKSNIGHCESAAGIAGVTKVLLQLKHRQLAPSLHSSVLNPNIDFTATPFVVQQTLAPWERPVVEKDGVTRTYPRIAGISSFGAGGANAHVVIEEYDAPVRTDVAQSGPALVVLSARNEEQLRQQVVQLSAFLEARKNDASLRLDELAYTLQVGREAMDERLGVAVHTLGELRSALAGYLAGEAEQQEIYRGQVKRTKEALSTLTGDEATNTLLSTWMAQGKQGKLLDLWVKGLPVAWKALYSQAPRRISLPTYPFARERYWLDVNAPQGAVNGATNTVLHPLLHRNTSDVSGLRFSTRLTGHEFYLADHVVRGSRILPGAAQLEMARCAAREAFGEDHGLQLRDIAWVRPVVVDADGLDLHIALYPEETGELPFEIYSDGEDGEPMVYSHGTAAVATLVASASLDLASLRSDCAAASLSASQCYALFEQMGLHYGPTFQGLAEISIGSSQLLARIVLPPTAPQEGYGMHPSLLDAALQATLGMQMDTTSGKVDTALMLPFALDALEMLRPSTSSMWVVVRPSVASKAGDAVRRLDLDLCDEQGAVCVRLRGLSLMPVLSTAVKPQPAARQAMSQASMQTLMFQPVWLARSVAKSTDAVYARHVILLGLDAAIERDLPDAICLRLPTDRDPARCFEAAAELLLEQLQAWSRQAGKLLLQIVVPDRGVHQTLRGLGGMLRTAALENSRVAGQLISVEPGQDVARALLENRGDDVQQVRYIDGKRQVAGWEEYSQATETPMPWKAGGVYLITGGAGGLGLIFARAIAGLARNPVLILTGRSASNERIQANLRQLETLGAVARYHAVDVADANALTELVRGIPEEFESLDGIIHSAGVLRDGYLVGKTSQQLREVLAAKVSGTLNLDEASRDIALDFFTCFSSIAGALGNPGQADYATGNAFMDAFVHYRSDLVAKGQRRGRTLSVNWPLWDEGGMQVDAATRAMLAQQLGMHALDSASGVASLQQALASGVSQLLVMAGDAARIREVLTGPSGQPAVPPVQAADEVVTVASMSAQPQPERLGRELVSMTSALIKVRVEDIDEDTSLSEYGFDSIMFAEFANALNQRYRLELKPTIFFEYPTLAGLAGHLVHEYPAIAQAQAGGANATAPATTAVSTKSMPVAVSAPISVTKRRTARGWNRPQKVATNAPASGQPFDVAIIGLSGRYPGASDVHRFWDNLVAGRNCISEVPPERWDSSKVFDPRRQQPGKTYTRWAGLVDDADSFDRLFFNITPQEARVISPQERLFMQEVYASIEDAGYTPETLCRSRKIGTYVGVLNEHYATGPRYWSIANRISYLLNFQGPSMAVDTACSSSLTAVHLAIESLRSGEIEVAIAGGVNLLVTPAHVIDLSSLEMLASGDKCKPFAADCDGFVDSEAVGALVLKPLQRAIDDGDHIYGVVKGSAINSGGKSHSYMTPNPNLQAQLVTDALQRAGIEPRTVSYIEAQGTGSSMGDPIEVAGLSKAFRSGTQDRQFCSIGSVKSNVGHSESASGFVGISKVLMQMKHRTLVPSLHAEVLNPNIDFADTPFFVQRALAEWKRPVLVIAGQQREVPRIAGVSSFGAGGANAHLVIEEYVAPPPVGWDAELRGPAMVVLSARDPRRLQEQVQRLAEAISPARISADVTLANLAYTLQVGREAMEERLALLVDSLDELRHKLAACAAGDADITGVYRGHAKRHAMAMLAGDEDIQLAVQAWVAKGKFTKLLELWVKGFGFDWNSLYEAGARARRPRRISLPTYPFARERYWTDVPYPEAPEVLATSFVRREVPVVDAPPVEASPSEPQAGPESTLLRLWQDLFGRASIEPDDDFFELGGHSLLATQLVSRIHIELGIELPVGAVFEAPSLKALAARLRLADAATGKPESLSSIHPVARDAALPLSFAQQRLWFLDQYEARRELYNLAASVRLSGQLDVNALSRTLNEIVHRHEALRTTFAMVGNEPVQRIVAASLPDLAITDLSGLSLAEREAETRLRTQEDAVALFDLSTGPLIRFHLIKLGDEEHILLLAMHHIVSDGWSMGVVVRELAALYRAFLQGEPSPLRPLPLQYADFAHWQREWLRGEILERQLSYWKRQLADSPSLLALPTDRPRPPQSSHAGATLPFALPATVVARLQELGRSARSTLFMTLCTAFNVLLARYSGQSDICIGTPIANRNRADIEGLIGFFVNTMVLRTQVDLKAGFTELLGQVRQHTLDAYAHQDVPFEQLVEALQPERHASYTPLFQVMLVLQNMPMGELSLPGLSLSLKESESVTSKFDLTLTLTEGREGLQGCFEYSTELFEARTIERMAGHFSRLLQAIVAEPERAVGELAMLDDAERQQLLYAFNDTGVMDPGIGPDRRVLHELFEAQAAMEPDGIAVVYQDASLTYAQLNAQANRLARHLRGWGVGPDVLVGLCVERSVAMIVGVLAILKAGGAYVPLDPAYPADRLSYTLADSAPVVVLVNGRESLPPAVQDILQESSMPVLDLQSDAAMWERADAGNLDVADIGLMPHHLAYIIYTSGSTGKPKGVMVAHGNVTRLLSSTDHWYGFGRNDVWTLFHSFAFDFSVWEIWGALAYGGKLVVVPQAVTRSPLEFHELLCAQGVTVLNQTPSAFRQLIAAQGDNARPHRLRYVIFGGEALELSALKPWYERSVNAATRLVNMYGITETTVHVTYLALAAADAYRVGPSPIGRQIPDLQLYVLDAHRQPAPIGVAGELYVGGAGVARGYLNRPELTAERFIAHPFIDDPQARLYKTGDVGRWLADGSVEYLGRNDEQVKIRGFRIELGEIEARIVDHPAVREAMVVVREDQPGDKRLVAYVVARDGQSMPDEAQLRATVAKNLPEYMLPNHFVALQAFPLTANGKLDRKALPAPDARRSEATYVAPRTPAEEVIAGIWAEVLKLDKVSVHDDFFALGGHSLLAIALIERMRRVELAVDIRQFFAEPTVAALAVATSKGGHGMVVPANAIPAGCTQITPEMVTLTKLSGEDIAAIVQRVPGGAANIQDIYPLAPAQEGILFHHRMAGERDAYLMEMLWAFETRSHLDRFVSAWETVIARHDAFRTAMVWEGLAEPMQVVWRHAPLPLEEVSLDPSGDVAAQLGERYNPLNYRLDVRQAPLLRCFVAEDAAQGRWLMQVLLHHLIDDNTSLKLLMGELKAVLDGRGATLPEPLPYRNFVAQARFGVSQAEHEAFFRPMLAHVDEPTAPFGMLNVQGDGTDIAEAQLKVESMLGRRLRQQARRLGVSTASLMHLAWAQVLSRLSGRKDVVFGTVLFGRMQSGEGSDRVLGIFINTLPVCIQTGAKTVLEGVRDTHSILTRLLRHEHAPLALAQRASSVVAPTPLFSSLFNYRHNVGADASAIDMLEGMRPLRVKERTNYPCLVSVDDSGDGFGIAVQIQGEDRAQRVCQYMHTVLEDLANALETQPEARIDSLDVIPATERQQLLQEWNGAATVATPALTQTVHSLFEAQAEHTPDLVAVMHNGVVLSYAELNRRANRLAHRLRSLGVGPDVLVGVCMARTPDLIVSLLGVLKAGGAYVPLDPAYPSERIATMLLDAQPRVLLTQSSLQAKLPEVSGMTVLCVETENARLDGECDDNLPPLAGGDDLAYVIYTSGSTGKPKGVAIRHRNTVAFIQWALATFDRESLAKVLASTSICFDLSIFEIFVPLSQGGSAWLVDNVLDFMQNASALPVTLVNTVPSAMAEVLRGRGLPASVKVVNLAGEALANSLAQALYQQPSVEKVYNLYGPSEDTTYSTFTLVEKGSNTPVSIGRPIDGTQAYILDAQGEPVPLGVAGELFIAGEGLARGYLQRPELTAEKFVPHPFSSLPGARMYRTGDLVRYRTDGEIEYLGRIDHQVKVRGFRIELGEIEAALQAVASEVVVLAREDSAGDKRLVAYLVAHEGRPLPSEPQLRAMLLRTLPEYMLPSYFITLEHMPLTPNGKVHRGALPAPDVTRSDMGYVAPRTPAEEIMAGLWAEVLKLDRVGIHDDFFALGGHSLLATRLVSRIQRALRIELPLRVLFDAPSIAALMERLADAGTVSSAPPLRPVDRDMPLALSFAQARLWFLDQLDRESALYNIPVALQLSGNLDMNALSRALDAILQRHEALRTRFADHEGSPVQVIMPAMALPLALSDLSDLSPKDRQAEARRLFKEEAQTPFDLESDLLIRSALLRLDEQEHILLLTMHHIVSDGWSIGVIVRELAALYQAFIRGEPSPLPPLPIQYADFAHWQREWLRGEVLEGQLRYWKRQLAGSPSLLTLPTDRPRPPQSSHAGATMPFVLPMALVTQLQSLGRTTQSTLFMTLCAAFNVLLARYSGQGDICIGTPIANRNRADIEALVGFFVNTLVLRTQVDLKAGFTELLGQVRQQTLEAYAHQDVPFEQLVEALQPERHTSYAPLFQVMLVLQNVPMDGMALPGLSLSLKESESVTSKFDLTLTLIESQEGLQGSFEYSTALFDACTIERMAGHFSRLLHAIVAAPERPVGELAMLDDAERHQLLHGFNDAAVVDSSTEHGSQTLHALFEEQAARTPDGVAVMHNGVALTYAELNRRANGMAHRLRSLGVGPDVLVGVCMTRTPDLVASLLGVLKAGGAYVPLDPAYPAGRIATMLLDAQPRVLLTQHSLQLELPAIDGMTVIRVDTQSASLAGERDDNPSLLATGDDLAYVIYTSGSTGTPKGVAIQHRNTVAFIRWALATFDRESLAKVLASTSVCFDLSIFELFVPLSQGGSAWLVDNILHFMENAGTLPVTLVNTVPSAMAEVLRARELPPSVKVVNLAGEALANSLAQALYQQPSVERVYNLYGPSEDTTYSTFTLVEKGSNAAVSIGRPIAGTQTYILDAQGEPVPRGVAGELFIAGDGLARGYLHRPELTTEKFVPNPFSSLPGTRMYRTGDLVRYRTDGEIEYLGRIDHQVKLRGFRIELGEIESALQAVASEVVVLAREDSIGDKRLVAYLVAHEGQVLPDEARLRAILAQTLPEYMLPSYFIVLERMPLTPNGKVNRGALPAPDMTRSEAGYVAPRTPTEEIMADLWAEVLKLDRVGIHDDFFALGGHSLLAVQLVSQLRKRAGIEMELRYLFSHPTLAALADFIDSSNASSRHPNLVPIRTQGHSTPLFLIHPIGGEVQYAFDLARHLDDDQRVYALAASGIAAGETPYASIVDMASVYLDAMRHVQASGPYLLAGWSLGGMIAYEIASQLLAAGEDVGFVGMIDTGSSPYLRAQLHAQGTAGFDDCAALMHWIADQPMAGADVRQHLAYAELMACAQSGDVDAMIATLQREDLLPAQLDMALMKRVLAVYRAGAAAGVGYEAPPITTTVTYFAADRGEGEDASYGWSALLGEGLEVTRIGGSHVSIVKPPRIEKLARAITQRIRRRLPNAALSSV